jgi:formamidopyrimidine-DNA glycosylase
LPDVENFKEYIDSTSLHKTIKRVEVKSEQILEDITKEKIEEQLENKEFLSTHRYGKYLFTKISEKAWLVIHFGMTGNLKYFKEIEDEPDHDRFLITFENSYHLAYDCQRKFGRITMANDIKEFIEKKNLGKDALEIGFEDFRKIIRQRKGTAKYTLMNQHIIAGIGNIYSDEILYQTRIHPKTKVDKLNDETIKDLFNNMKRILRTAIRNQADPTQLPSHYLIPNRSEGANCPDCDGNIERIKVSSRTSYYCPKCQKMKK